MKLKGVKCTMFGVAILILSCLLAGCAGNQHHNEKQNLSAHQSSSNSQSSQVAYQEEKEQQVEGTGRLERSLTGQQIFTSTHVEPVLTADKFKLINENKRPTSGPQTENHQAGLGQQDGAEQTATNKNGDHESDIRQQHQHQHHHNHLHKLMSEQDLRRTFHVDSHDQVPEYEILKLTVASDGSHMISPISDLGELLQEHEHDLVGQSGANEAPVRRQGNTSHENELNRSRRSVAAQKSASVDIIIQAPERAPLLEMQTMKTTTTTSTTNSDTKQDAKTTISKSKDNQKNTIRQQSTSQSGAGVDSADEAAAEPIVMKLSTFGQNYNLRLKRNSNFQQRIKDMKMFLAESTKDGQLRYTEIKQPAKQEPHKRQANPDNLDASQTTASDSGAANDQAKQQQQAGKSADPWNLGHTYHDEENLAALLIERDAKTGNLRVDGTIGNDFVIRPLPVGALEAARQHASANPSQSSESHNIDVKNDRQPNELEASAAAVADHMHDDDPHDDDEMFLDEDEALELAHAHSRHSAINEPQSAATNQSNENANSLAVQTGAAVAVAGVSTLANSTTNSSVGRTLSKAASERKWRKYRKLVAQTRVPKSQEIPSTSARARRALNGISHHVIYRQKQSSESSSAEHQGSPLAMARRLASGELGRAKVEAGEKRSQDAHLDGQFWLEPADLNAPADWSLYSNSSTYNDESAHSRRHKRSTGTGQTTNRRFKRQAPDTVWPEVLLVVDYDSFLLHGGDSRDVKRYFVSFWNGVDLRYKLLVHPHIRISLAGMIVAKDRDATPYLERNRLRAPNADAVDAAGALTDMGKYLYREDRLPTYDLAVVITKLDMCRRRYEGGRCNRGTAGFAYVGGACVVNKRLEKVNSVAIIEDSGGFSGIIVAAHEVGHLLGCVHDGSPPPSYLGGPGATHCPWEDGFIMSDLRHTERGFRWSQCSVEQFKHFLNGETATCLYNYPHESQMLHRLLPGTMLSLDEQCKRDRGTNACFKDARVCAQLFCFDSASGYCVSYRPAAEGSPCGEGQVCRNGKCVGEIENIIPDYTHHSQTVVARRPPGHLAARLADNGLSASSTSTATTAPDIIKPAISSRMDSVYGGPQEVTAGTSYLTFGDRHTSSEPTLMMLAPASQAPSHLQGTTNLGRARNNSARKLQDQTSSYQPDQQQAYRQRFGSQHAAATSTTGITTSKIGHPSVGHPPSTGHPFTGHPYTDPLAQSSALSW